jgi:hypothetical protein
VSPGQLVPQAVCGGLTADGNAAANQVAIYSGACALTEDTKFVDVSGKIGVGTSAPQAPLDVRGAFTATSGTLYAQDTLASFNPSANSTATGVGDYVQAGVMSGNANNVSLIASLEFLSFHEGTGTVSFEEGMQGKVYNESTGTVTTAEGIYAQIRNESTGTISSGYGLYVDAPLNSGGGTFTNYYGLYLANPTAATKNYSLYSAGGTNYFAGSVGMGTATPSAALEVNGTAKFDGLATFAGGQTFPGTLTGATAGGGLAVSGSTVGLLTSCASGQVLSWSGAAWQCASGGGGGGGTITGVTAGTDLTGGGTSGVVTLNVDTTKVPQLASANPFTNSQTVNASAAGVTAVNITATDTTTANTAVDGLADGPNGTGVIGEADNGATAVGIWGLSSSGLAGLFSGNVNVTGSVSKTGGSFKIDDPIDPANKYLYHSFVESPDMKNIYDGVAVLDANGEAVIQLPAWFGALNRDFRYQLTCIGGFAPVYISQEVSNNQFGIAGGKAGMKVSWQVTGIRQDAWANANRIPVEQEKPAKERGYYLYPELFGAPRDKNVLFAEHPEMLGKTGATK